MTARASARALDPTSASSSQARSTRRRFGPGRLGALLGLVTLVAGCAFPAVFVRTNPDVVVLFPGESVTVTVTTDPPRCIPNEENPDQPCVDVTGQVFAYVVQNIPAGVTTSIDTSLQNPSTQGVVRITVEAGDTAAPGLYEMTVHATLAGRGLGTAALQLRILSTAGPGTTATPSAVAAGHEHSVAALADGTLLAWGENGEGQLGLGDRTDRFTPTAVPIPVAVRAVSAGLEHTLALGTDGSVWAWGNNDFLQLGLGQIVGSSTRPSQVPGLDAQAIAAGGSFSLALGTDGTVWSWGRGSPGGGSASPARIEGLSSIQAIAAGWGHALALAADGTVWAWGLNDLGQVGSPASPLDVVRVPFQVPGLTDVAAIAAGDGYSLAARVDGTVWAWGRQIGQETESDEPAPVPAQVSGLGGIQAVAAGREHALGLAIDGTVWAWGRSALLGDGILDPDVRANPVPVPGLDGVQAIAAGASHSLAVLECGQLWSWGLNPEGRLGTNTTRQHLTPVPVAEVGQDSACPRLSLRVSVAGEGEGRVASSPEGLTCLDRECLGVFDRGSAVTLEARPFFDSAFEGWDGACQGLDLQAAVVLEARAHCVARFRAAAPAPFLLTIVTDGGRVISTGGGVLGPDHIDCEPTCSAIFPQNTEVTLAAAEGSGFGFTGWTLDCSGTARQTSILMDARHTCRAEFRPFTLGVTVSGAGRVTSDPAGLDCGATCSYAPRAGTAILRAEPALGWQLDGWGGDCTGAGLQATVTMDADRACTATFSRIPGLFFLTMIVEGTGTVTSAPAGIDCPGECVALFPAGAAVELTAAETPQSLVLGWFDDCAAAGVLVNRVVMDGDRTCRLRFTDRPAVPVALFSFAPGPYAVGEVIIFDAGASHVLDPVTGTQDPAGIRAFNWDFENDGPFEVAGPRGTAAIVQHAFQAPGTYTVRLQVRGGPFDETADRLHDVTIVSASGALHGLTVQKAGDGDGTIVTSPPGLIGCGAGCASAGPVQVEEDRLVGLVAQAAPGSTFTGWSGTGCTSASATVEVTMSADRTCTAAFTRDSVVLTASSSGGGRVTSSPAGIDCGSDCTESYGRGTAVMLTASPDAGFQFDGWSLDCAGTNPVTQVVLDGDRACHATFSPVPAEPVLTVEVTRPAGSIGRIIGVSPPGNPIDCDGVGPVCVATFPSGTIVTVRPSDTSIELALFGSWAGCDSVGGLAACTVTLTGSRTVAATFVR
jgi:alpha-tubulin suppressor-like RCC1 family protein/PKD repeat protein